ncbi:MAG: hypothetical protein ACM3YE_06270 [Bacteroidota bacterium]
MVWGDNEDGQLGNGGGPEEYRPLPVNGLSGVTTVAASGHVLALKSDGTVWGWGNNQFGQVGGTDGSVFRPIRISGL